MASRRGDMVELMECRRKLTEVVDEVLYCEAQISSLTQQNATLQQALADSTKAHGSVIEAFSHYQSLVKVLIPPQQHPSNERIQLQKATRDISTSLESLRNFQQLLQRSLINDNIQLPEPKYVAPKLAYCRLPSSQLDLTIANAASAEFELEEKEEEWSKERAKLTQTIRKLENQLDAAKKEQMWPFGDDQLSHSDSFGMSSNSRLARMTVSGKASEAREVELEKLKEEMEDLRRSHKKEKERMMRQAEAEIRDACLQVHSLQQLLRKTQDYAGDDLLGTETTSPQPSRAAEHSRNRRAASMPVELNKERMQSLSRRQSLPIEAEKKGLDEEVASSYVLNHAEELGYDADKAHRDRELFSKEQRASQVRHQALLEDLSHVLEERDRALAETCAHRKTAALAEKAAKDWKNKLHNALGRLRKADEGAQRLKEEKAKLEAETDGYVRTKVNLEQDIEVLKKRLQSVELERDAAIKEQHHALARIDKAAEERRAVVQEKFEAEAKTDAAERRLQAAVDAVKRCEEEKLAVENELIATKTELAQAKVRLEERRSTQEQAQRQLAIEKDDRQSALQELETVQRQLNALKKEMKSVLRVRDIALEQRDLAVNELRHIQGYKPRSGTSGRSVSVPSRATDIPRTEIFLDDLRERESGEKPERQKGECPDSGQERLKFEAQRLSFERVQKQLEEEVMSTKSENSRLRGEVRELKSQTIDMQRYRRRVHEIGSTVDGIERAGSLQLGLRTRLPEVERGATLDSALDDLEARVKHLQYIMDKVREAATRSSLGEAEVAQLKETVLQQARDLKGMSKEARSSDDVAFELKRKITELQRENEKLGARLKRREEELSVERDQFEVCLGRLERSDAQVAHLEETLKQRDVQQESYEELEEKLDSAAVRLRSAARDKSIALEDMQDLCLALKDAEGDVEKEREKNRVLERQIGALMRLKSEHSRRSKALVGNITITKDGSVLIDKRLIGK